ncbi:hypothetical protein TIFTF001_036576 [Ficus carica]|uniref:Uncharacterized protein n=1 Tax=Ficus carica TaxID=3494 RepID=A0AA88JCW5_FICCA|nr:hypothetical protein TIFTF001_036576 [Ficus carica]
MITKNMIRHCSMISEVQDIIFRWSHHIPQRRRTVPVLRPLHPHLESLHLLSLVPVFVRHCGGGGGGDHERIRRTQNRGLAEKVAVKNVVDGGVAKGEGVACGGEDEDGDLCAVEQAADVCGLPEKANASLGEGGKLNLVLD